MELAFMGFMGLLISYFYHSVPFTVDLTNISLKKQQTVFNRQTFQRKVIRRNFS